MRWLHAYAFPRTRKGTRVCTDRGGHEAASGHNENKGVIDVRIEYIVEALLKKPQDAEFLFRDDLGRIVDVEIRDDGASTVSPFVICRKGSR